MIRVLVVEDPAGRRRLVDALEADGDIDVVGEAGAAQEAIDLAHALRPDVITLDVQLAGGGGLYVIEQVMAFMPTPILVLSATVAGPESDAAVSALVAGAVDALPRPTSWDERASRSLREHVRVVKGVAVIRHVRGRIAARREAAAKTAGPAGSSPVVAIAASTGGPAAMATVLEGLTGLKAIVLIVQHLHPDFVDGFVTWMARVSPLPVERAAHGAALVPGKVYIGPGEVHLRLGPGDHVDLDPEPRTLHRPSADALFSSIADAHRPRVGVLLTGMGADGARGLLELRKKGGFTIVQDEATSAVYGMPAAAERLGAADRVVALDRIAAAILRAAHA